MLQADSVMHSTRKQLHDRVPVSLIKWTWLSLAAQSVSYLINSTALGCSSFHIFSIYIILLFFNNKYCLIGIMTPFFVFKPRLNKRKKTFQIDALAKMDVICWCSIFWHAYMRQIPCIGTQLSFTTVLVHASSILLARPCNISIKHSAVFQHIGFMIFIGPIKLWSNSIGPGRKFLQREIDLAPRWKLRASCRARFRCSLSCLISKSSAKHIVD